MQFEGNINIFPNYTPDDAREVAGVVCSPDLVTLLMMAFLRAVFRQMQRKGWPMVWPTVKEKAVQKVDLDGRFLEPQLRKTMQNGVIQAKKKAVMMNIFDETFLSGLDIILLVISTTPYLPISLVASYMVCPILIQIMMIKISGRTKAMVPCQSTQVVCKQKKQMKEVGNPLHCGWQKCRCCRSHLQIPSVRREVGGEE